MKTILEVPDSLKSYVFKLFDKKEDEVQQDLDIVYTWWEKQKHLPFVKDDSILLNTLMKNKFRVEQTKKKLDAYFTLKTRFSQYFDVKILEPGNQNMATTLKSNFNFPMKKPMPNGERLWIMKMKDINPDLYNIVDILNFSFLYLEILNKYDFCCSLRIIFDAEGFNLSIFRKWDIVSIVNVFKIFREGFSGRVAGLHYLNAPSFMDLIIKLMTNALKENKITVHKSFDEFYKIVGKEYLPSDLGGHLQSLEDMESEWMEELQQQKDYLFERYQLVTNERLRMEKLEDSEYFGADGTFKALNID